VHRDKIRDAKNEVALSAEEGAKIFGELQVSQDKYKEVYTDINGVKVKDVKFDKQKITTQKTDIESGVERKVLEQDIVKFKDVKTNEQLKPIT
jgi:hypothetical protein